MAAGLNFVLCFLGLKYRSLSIDFSVVVNFASNNLSSFSCHLACNRTKTGEF